MEFLIGLAAAIPLSIAGNLLTPRLERWWGRWSDARAASNDQRASEEDAEARRFARHPEHLSLEMQRATLWVVLMGLIATLGAGIFVLILVGSPGQPKNDVGATASKAIATLMELIAIVVLIGITRRASTWMRVARRVRTIWYQEEAAQRDRADPESPPGS